MGFKRNLCFPFSDRGRSAAATTVAIAAVAAATAATVAVAVTTGTAQSILIYQNTTDKK
jgi:hypothetical protein